MKDIIYTEKLNSIRNEMNHLWTSFFIVGGGSITILFNKPNFVIVTFATIGILFSLLFLNAYLIRRQEVKNLLKKLEEEI